MSISELEAAPRKSRGARPHGTVKPCPLTRDQLDSRTSAAKLWDNLAANITADCGGEANISTVQRTLIDAFCSVAIRLNDLNTRGLLGQPVDLSELSLAASTLTRLATRIGITRVPKDVSPSLSEIIRQDLAQQTARERAARHRDAEGNPAFDGYDPNG